MIINKDKDSKMKLGKVRYRNKIVKANRIKNAIKRK